jgi:predicted MFS family arabinose efflux permease
MAANDCAKGFIVPSRRSNLSRQLALIVALTAAGYGRTVLSPLQESVRHGIGLNDDQIALLQGLAFAIPVVIFSIPIGMLVDRYRRTLVLAGLLGLCAAGTLVSALATNFAVLFAARIMVGLGVSGAQTAVISLSADLFPPTQRGRATMSLTIGQTAGIALAFAIGGQLLSWVGSSPNGWRHVMLLMAVPIVLIACLALLISEPPRQGTEATGPLDLSQAMKELKKYASVILPLALGIITVGMADVAATVWAAPVLSRNYGLSPEAVGRLMGLVVLVGGGVGVISGGFLTDVAQRLGGRRGAMWVALIATALSVPCATFAVMPNTAVFGVMLACLLVAGGAVSVTTTTLLTLVIPNELRGFTLGFVQAATAIICTGASPIAVSLLSRTFGGPTHIAAALGWVGAVTSLAGLAAFVSATAALPRASRVSH